jgi:hypothetical protein
MRHESLIMKPLQVYMSEGELARLDAWSRQHGMNKSQAVRAAVRAITRAADEDPLLGLSGSIQGLPHDASARIDEYLQETFVARPPQSQRPAKARVRR